MTIQCPNCTAELSTAGLTSGGTAVCGICGRAMIVPLIDPPAPSDAPTSLTEFNFRTPRKQTKSGWRKRLKYAGICLLFVPVACVMYVFGVALEQATEPAGGSAAPVAGSAPQAPMTWYGRGYAIGEIAGNMDRNYDTLHDAQFETYYADWVDLLESQGDAEALKNFKAVIPEVGTNEYGEFIGGYNAGYAARRFPQ